LQWICFGNETLVKMDRSGQQKLIRYNHLVGNLVVYHNVVHLTKVLEQIALQGTKITDEMLAALAPYRTEHINRFGIYEVTDQIDTIPMYGLNI
jgi:hypothetical protein